MTHLTNMDQPNKIVKQFGGKDAYLKAVQDLSNMIYGVA